MDVMLSKAKHLVSSRGYEDEIVRLRLRMTSRRSVLPQKGSVHTTSLDFHGAQFP